MILHRSFLSTIDTGTRQARLDTQPHDFGVAPPFPEVAVHCKRVMTERSTLDVVRRLAIQSVRAIGMFVAKAARLAPVVEACQKDPGDIHLQLSHSSFSCSGSSAQILSLVVFNVKA